jgi:hypothetical protein
MTGQAEGLAYKRVVLEQLDGNDLAVKTGMSAKTPESGFGNL